MSTNLQELKYCPRTKDCHKSWKLKAPHPCCVQRGKNQSNKNIDPGECCFYPTLIRYCKKNKIDVKMSTSFRCVLAKKVK